MPKLDYTIFDPTIGGTDTIVDTDSQAFLDRVSYIMRRSGADTYRLVFGRSVAPAADGNGNILVGKYSVYDNGDVIFTEASTEVAINCYLLHKSPEVALVEVCKTLGLAVPHPLPPFADELVIESPVGSPWPAQGSRVFNVSTVFQATPSKWPESFLFRGRLDGRDVTWQRIRVRGSQPGQGPFGAGGSWEPAWILVG